MLIVENKANSRYERKLRFMRFCNENGFIFNDIVLPKIHKRNNNKDVELWQGEMKEF
jgi:hypothetical protein